MKHARADYERFQDPDGKIGKDEPVFLFRAQDKHFANVLMYYRTLIIDDEEADPAIVKAIDDHISLTLEWQKTNSQKSPDL